MATIKIAVYEGNVLDGTFGKVGGWSGEGIFRTNSTEALVDAAGEDENSIDNVDVRFNISYDTLLVDLGSLNNKNIVEEPRYFKNTNLRKGL